MYRVTHQHYYHVCNNPFVSVLSVRPVSTWSFFLVFGDVYLYLYLNNKGKISASFLVWIIFGLDWIFFGLFFQIIFKKYIYYLFLLRQIYLFKISGVFFFSFSLFVMAQQSAHSFVPAGLTTLAQVESLLSEKITIEFLSTICAAARSSSSVLPHRQARSSPHAAASLFQRPASPLWLRRRFIE